MNIVVIGGGKMGLPLACQMSSKGGQVTVCDTNQNLVGMINAGQCPFDEPELPEKLSQNVSSGALKATVDTASAVSMADVVIVIVPVLLTAANDADTSIIEAVAKTIARSMKPGAMICFETTLPTGTTRRLATILESEGRKAGVDFDLVFSPERVKSRLVFQRLSENPKVVGSLTPAGEERAAKFYSEYLGAPVIRMGSLEASELVKLAGMIFRDVNIALANELTAYADLYNLDIKAIIEAANTDGETFMLQPGIGVGGHCTPVYPHFLLRDAERKGLPIPITEISRTTNDRRPAAVIARVEKMWGALQDKKVTILGLGFRPGVKEHICSPAFALRDELVARGAEVSVHDPLYDSKEISALGFVPGTPYGSEVVILNTAHDEYKQMDFSKMKGAGLQLVIDGRNFWDQKNVSSCGLAYLGMGRTSIDKGPQSAPAPQANIPLSKLSLTELEAAAASRVVRSGWIMQGPEVEAFESEFSDFVDAPYSCAVSSCTAALMMALQALGVGPGDEVITVSHSFIATANSIVLIGATPVFADIDPLTLNISPSEVEALINERTKALLVVHQLGMPCDMRAIMKIAGKHGIPVIEDAACALGSEIKMQDKFERIGAPIGDIACFSFHPRKIISTGDGGMLATRSAELDARFRLLRNHGMTIPTSSRKTGTTYVREQYMESTWNFRLSDLQAAVGREQLRRLPGLVEGRRKLATRYHELLTGLEGASFFCEPDYAKTNWQSFAVRLAVPVERSGVIEGMQARGIATRPGISCAHAEPAFSKSPWGCRAGTPSTCTNCQHLQHSIKARDYCLILPLYNGLSDQDQIRVASTLTEILQSVRQHT